MNIQILFEAFFVC